jgi:hypothetical protein
MPRALRIMAYYFCVPAEAICEACHVWFRAQIPHPPDAKNTLAQLQRAFDAHTCRVGGVNGAPSQGWEEAPSSGLQ